MTLLEKAQAVGSNKHRRTNGSMEELELVLAWLSREISDIQLGTALNVKQRSSARSKATAIIRAGVFSGRVSITLNNQTNGSAA